MTWRCGATKSGVVSVCIPIVHSMHGIGIYIYIYDRKLLGLLGWRQGLSADLRVGPDDLDHPVLADCLPCGAFEAALLSDSAG